MKKLKTKLTETRACPFYEDVIDMVCYALMGGAIGWFVMAYFNCRERLDAVTDNYKCAKDLIQTHRKVNNNWAKLYQLSKCNYELMKDREDIHKRAIKNGRVYVDGEWYRTEKRDSYKDCLK